MAVNHVWIFSCWKSSNQPSASVSRKACVAWSRSSQCTHCGQNLFEFAIESSISWDILWILKVVSDVKACLYYCEDPVGSFENFNLSFSVQASLVSLNFFERLLAFSQQHDIENKSLRLWLYDEKNQLICKSTKMQLYENFGPVVVVLDYFPEEKKFHPLKFS